MLIVTRDFIKKWSLLDKSKEEDKGTEEHVKLAPDSKKPEILL